MESRLVMYQLGDTDLTNADMSGKFRQELGYEYFRRVSTKKGKSIFYLFYARETNTYDALMAAKKIKHISVARYRHQNRVLPPPVHPHDFSHEEMSFHPGHCPKIVNYLRCAFSKHVEKFSSRNWFKVLIYRLAGQIHARKLRMIGVQEHMYRMDRWWWLSEKFMVEDTYDVQKLMDVFFTYQL